jgi:16S rRNA A1518/A1519 N6-dimethyltransferase RsmA/KsgA/DIM1 with predicted DNA glycosylase/AP lyase activity
MNPDAMAEFAQTSHGQYFLTNPVLLQRIADAASIKASDRVVEIGAGVGTVAKMLPECDLTLVETDPRAIDILKAEVPHARVVLADGIDLLASGAAPCDILLSNLPWPVTEKLVETLPGLAIRRAVLAASPATSLDSLTDLFDVELIATAEGADYTPPQPGRSNLVLLVSKTRD